MITMTRSPDRLQAVLLVGPGEEPLDQVVAATAVAVEEAFAQGVQQILWRAEVGDVRSRRVAWAGGFTFHGLLRQDWSAEGRLGDAWLATLLADDSREPKTRWLEPVTMSAPSVVLRDEQARDEVRYLETINDAESLRWLGTLSIPRTPEIFRRMLARLHDGRSVGASVAWTIAEPGTDTYLGTISLFGMNGIDHLSAEVGYRVHPDARGRGITASALRRVAAHAFESEQQGGLGLERLSLGAGAGNLGSQGVARAAGFTETGRDRRCYDLYDGTVVDLVRFDRLSSDPAAG
jgi:[ribosomal protein S5]-alanine N-acetyltransferase